MKLITSACLLCALFGKNAAVNHYCVSNTGSTLSIDFDDPSVSTTNLCTYPRGDLGSRETRRCTWLFNIVGKRQPTQLALELEFNDRYKNSSFSSFNLRGSVFAGILNVTPSFCDSRRRHPYIWNPEQHFQLLPLQNTPISVAIEIDNEEKKNVSDLFYLRLAFSSLNNCTDHLVNYKGRCYAVRVTDKMAQAATFSSEEDIRNFLKAYERAPAESKMGNADFTSTGVRLAMSYCNLTGSLQYRDPYVCNCTNVPISGANRSLPGHGDCVLVRADPTTEAPLFQPVACIGPMATLLSFSSVPTGIGCGGNKPGALQPRCPANVSGNCCFAPPGSTQGISGLLLLAIAVAVAVAVAAAVAAVVIFRMITKRTPRTIRLEDGNQLDGKQNLDQNCDSSVPNDGQHEDVIPMVIRATREQSPSGCNDARL